VSATSISSAAEVSKSPPTLVWTVAQAGAVIAALAIFVSVEVGRWGRLPPFQGDPFVWLIGCDHDTTLYAIPLALIPVAWLLRGRVLQVTWSTSQRRGSATDSPRNGTQHDSLLSSAAYFGLFCAMGVATSAIVGWDWQNLPLSIHDEYSYLFQARTYLAGRLAFPSHPTVPHMFDQMHVLNEGTFVSRYFPLVGLWIAPWLAIGRPMWGHWFANGLCAGLMFLIGQRLRDRWTGVVAGSLCGLCCGMAIFSNMLVAHHPGLVGLLLFLYAWIRGRDSGSRTWLAISGAALAAAMLCRPMTAAGFAAPFGVATAIDWLWGRRTAITGGGTRNFTSRTLDAVALGSPLLVGFGLLAGYNLATTGSAWTTAYQLYTDTYTPRHRFGFYNVSRGEKRVGPRVIDAYDRWARELTPESSLSVAFHRLHISLRLTLGVIPLAMSAVVGLVLWPWIGWNTRLIGAAILSMHVAHVPYWFDGLFNYHYVFETGVLWLLWFSVVSRLLWQRWTQQLQFGRQFWWLGLLATAATLAYTSAPPWWGSYLNLASNMRLYSATRYVRFQNEIERGVRSRPALVLVNPDPADIHGELINNHPGLTGDVLIGRYLPKEYSLEQVRAAFPDRTFYLYDQRSDRLQRLD
jgi:hypothetical protein